MGLFDVLDGDEEIFSARVWTGDNEAREVKGDELRFGEFCDGDAEGDGVLANGDNGAWMADFRLLNLEA